MERKGMKGLHEMVSRRGAGVSMPEETSIGDDIQIVLSVNSDSNKADIRYLLKLIEDHGAISEAKIIAHKDFV